jgi:hypothetical protein
MEKWSVYPFLLVNSSPGLLGQCPTPIIVALSGKRTNGCERTSNGCNRFLSDRTLVSIVESSPETHMVPTSSKRLH